ncbi:MAG: hypothetical protein B7X57_08345 [Erythrobacter sp. 34-65-8]|nr:MAG: hypothetical protein B7X57_08345 [Erythrobacter sp. 34-65-8]
MHEFYSQFHVTRDLLELRNLVQVAELLSRHPAFEKLSVEILHGKMPAEQKDAVMQAFAAGLLPDAHEKASYFRWLFFAAGPLEQAVVAQSMGWSVPEGKTGMAGFGSLDLTLDTLDAWFSAYDYVCGNRFTMADTYVGSQFIWGLRFGSIPERPAFRAYVERCTARPRYQEGLAVDAALIAEASGS